MQLAPQPYASDGAMNEALYPKTCIAVGLCTLNQVDP
jgi:hypothetical protein